MRTDFDLIREAPLPDSFDRTADWLRSAPPPRPSAARPIALVAALMVAVGACSWPVEADAVLGWVVEARTAEPFGLISALDDVVPDEGRVSIEVEPVGSASAVRYVVLDRDDAARAQSAAKGVEGASSVRVSALDGRVRQPLGWAAARWLGVSVGPRLSDAELQSALDRAFADHPTLAPRVGRMEDGQRVVDIDEHSRLVLRPGVRVGRAGADGVVVMGKDLGGYTIGGVPVQELLGRATAGETLASGPGVTARTLSPAEAQALADSLGIPVRSLSRSGSLDSVRSYFIRVEDDTDEASGQAPTPAPLPDGP